MIHGNEDETLFWAKTILGYVGAAILAVVYIPQVIRVYKRRDAKLLSPIFLSLGWIATIDMTVYGILIQEWPVIVANIMLFICLSLLLIAKCLFRETKENTPNTVNMANIPNTENVENMGDNQA